jgi:hypothetical protein
VGFVFSWHLSLVIRRFPVVDLFPDRARDNDYRTIHNDKQIIAGRILLPGFCCQAFAARLLLEEELWKNS